MTMHWKAAAAAAAIAALLTGCASNVSLDEGAKNGTLAGEAAQTEQVAANPFTDPANPLSQRSIYFGFDAYDVAPEYVPYIEAHAKWLIEHPEVKIAIQGNTDERGGREYNLALGQKRSEAVKQRLILLGVPASRLEAVSFGKESPSPRATPKKPGRRTAAPTSFIRRSTPPLRSPLRLNRALPRPHSPDR